MRHFVDQAKIKVKAGDGGDGAVSFRREKYVPKGGPDGGDGGKGGNVYLVGDNDLGTLLDFQERRLFKAESGKRGGKSNRTGASGEDLYLKVPTGTQIFEITNTDFEFNQEESQEEQLIADIIQDGQEVLIAHGGDGGRGNTRFKSSTNQVPRESTPGEPGEEKELVLELKLLADVGLIGLPSAGKSTLLSVLTNAHPEIGAYRFTTLHPNLGVLRFSDDHEIILADIPGLIQGAAEGKGLGDEFLRHIERTKILVHLVDPFTAASELGQEVSVQSTLKAYQVIREELGDYSQELLDKPELIVISKIDILEKELVKNLKSELAKEDKKVITISAVTREGLDGLKSELAQMIKSVPETEPEPITRAPVFTLEDLQR